MKIKLLLFLFFLSFALDALSQVKICPGQGKWQLCDSRGQAVGSAYDTIMEVFARAQGKEKELSFFLGCKSRPQYTERTEAGLYAQPIAYRVIYFPSGSFDIIDKQGKTSMKNISNIKLSLWWQHDGSEGIFTADLGSAERPLLGNELVTAGELPFPVKQNKKWGVYTVSGKRIVPAKYDEITYRYLFSMLDSIPFSFLIEARSEGASSIYDLHGNILLKPKYASIGDFNDLATFPNAIVTVGRKKGLISRTCAELVPPVYDTVIFLRRPNDYPYPVVYLLGRNGGSTVYTAHIESQFYEDPYSVEMKEVKDTTWLPYLSGGSVDVRDSTGKLIQAGVTNFVFMQAGIEGNMLRDLFGPAPYNTFRERGAYPMLAWNENHVFYIKANGKWGAIDHTGKELIPVIYDSLQFAFDDHKVMISANNKWGLYGMGRKEIISPVYDTLVTIYDELGYAMFYIGYKGGRVKKQASVFKRFDIDMWTGLEIEVEDTLTGSYFSGGTVDVFDTSGVAIRTGVSDIVYEGVHYGDAEKHKRISLFAMPVIPFEGFAAIYHHAPLIMQVNGKWGALRRDGQEEVPFIYNTAAEVEAMLDKE